ncbi:MAG TPA: MFS transporter [Pirellulaceae bacterium]|nr:MFS transporter [Pirellulaceae bacterium]
MNRPDTPTDTARWRQLALLAAVELLAMALWFSASAVTPALKQPWELSDGAAAWLTISVQLGFVIGALASAVLNLSERIAPPRMLAGCALLGAIFNGLIPLGISDELGRTAGGFAMVVLLRMATGVMLAGVYPTGMKLMATWFKQRRGLAIGVLVGALTVGSASPHLVNALPLDEWSRQYLGGVSGWAVVMLAASASAVVAAALAAMFVRSGPHLPAAARFDWRYFARVWAEPALRRANFGYLGHMFELYAMWTWAPQLLAASYAHADWNASAARAAGFATVAIGSVGCVLAGLAADRAGRCWTTVVSLVLSGGCALVAGALFDWPGALTVVCLVWGFAVVADSAQFSAAISELCDPQFVGTALTIQTCAGFLLTTLTIQAVPWMLGETGTSGGSAAWWPALAILAAGPVFGVFHMLRLRQMPEAEKMAGGAR